MTSISPPPLYEPVVEKSDDPAINTHIATPAWALFFNSIFTGDTGTDWTPTFQNLGSTGTPTFSGRHYRIGRSLSYFRIVITPATNTTSVSGTTYCDNFPLTMRGDGVCFSVDPAAGVGGSIGVCQESNNRIYTPSWTSVTNPVIIIGMVEAR